MTPNVFISYSHRQAEWVHRRLAPVIRASGAEVVLDVADGRAGLSLDVQMRRWGDAAAHVVAVLSPDYLRSDACRLEWERAQARDPGFLNGGTLIPVLRETCDPMPPALQGTAGPLYLDLRTDGRGKPDGAVERAWRALLAVWGGTLGTTVTDWLAALCAIRRDLDEGKHVSLCAAPPVHWKELIAALPGEDATATLPTVDLAKPALWELTGFLDGVLGAFGVRAATPGGGDPVAELAAFSRALGALPPQRLVLRNFQKARTLSGFGAHLFDALRYHAMDDDRNLTLLVHTTEPFGGLLPAGHILSQMTAAHIHLRPRR
ncbi:toll/interleukin-1 receptor domain-containing protein [Azospirillum sp. RWY-5-1]|uniref:Toll/interleukin-1 receptor domain-containing protein n=1 Tax=Azospirillum oleiclasticum TaxID=2735135 RepID=A0ABX2THL1_9PROT|nr:toll/interleukin-1 receptor domain-containing protein [Azospirillum oleiclasticum]NYZ15496.1 toll/interleukin-1 receptor domain-containing protein [Azospirillum oleiclasticum]NYZ22519.1 toll/interleukin-1 receptor domain-containing protein [Azospirillum oleiclasticum]